VVVTVAGLGGCPCNRDGTGASDGAAVDGRQPDARSPDQSEADATPRDAELVAPDAGLDAGPDVGVPDTGCPPLPLPEGVPPDWEEYTDWSCNCRFYVPGQKGTMPPPIEWEPCSADAGVPGCRQMKCSWSPLGCAAFGGLDSMYCTDPATGGPLLGFTRGLLEGVAGRNVFLIAEPDGPVRFAIVELHAGEMGCALRPFSLNEGRFSMDPYDNTPDPPLEYLNEGVIASVVDDRHPPVLMRWHGARVTAVSADWLVEATLPEILAHDWGLSTTRLVYSSGTDPDHLPPHDPVLVGPDIFLTVAGGGVSYVMSFNPTDGTRPLLRWQGDYTRGASNFGTDGHDMVWTYGEGRPPGGWYHEYASYSTMTAPYSTDPAVVQATARKLRSEPNGQLVGTDERWVVGCGYAAHHARRANLLMIARLSDGAMWAIPDPQVGAYMWGATLGVTCDEVFVGVFFRPNGGTIARIRLDSLGPPLPPE
jgi:hypothetical protein